MAICTIIAIGQMKEQAERTLYQNYLSRIQMPMNSIELKPAKSQTKELRKTEETSAIIKKFPTHPALFILDERGDNITSIVFSKMLVDSVEMALNPTFVIGGDEGFNYDLFPKQARYLSFSKLTWPHRMVRIMLAEQIFRAEAIANNHPYHRA